MLDDPVEVMDYIHNWLDTNKVSLGLTYVSYGDPSLVFDYPACVIAGGPVTTEVHTTARFLHHFRIGIFVYHAKIDVNRDTRTREDLLLVRSIKNLLHSDFDLQNNIIFGYIESQQPATITRPNEQVIGTLMTWYGRSQETFPAQT